jgi:hypothetical protein
MDVVEDGSGAADVMWLWLQHDCYGAEGDHNMGTCCRGTGMIGVGVRRASMFCGTQKAGVDSEDDSAFAPLELHLHGGEVSEDVAKVGHSWRAEDDGDVDADVHQKGVDLERLNVDA